jgi:predicted transposase YdaD
MAIADRDSDRAAAEQRGMDKGITQCIAQGIAQGKNEERLVIAKNALLSGINIDEIIKFTGITREEAENMRSLH